MTEQFVNQEEERLQTVSRQDTTAEYQTCGRMETVLLKNQAGNGVIEWK